MRTLHIEEQAWRSLKEAFIHEQPSPGITVIHGPSSVLSREIQELLEESHSQQRRVAYFPCFGNPDFRSPCYLPPNLLEMTPDEIQAQDVLECAHLLQPGQPSMSLHTVVDALIESLRTPESAPHGLVLEYMTAPCSDEEAFLLLLLRSTLPEYIAIFICAHDNDSACLPPMPGCHAEELLYSIYMSGGQIIQADLERLLARLQVPQEQLDRYLLARMRDGETWWTYRSKSLATLIENHFSTLDLGRKRDLARCLLPCLTHRINYPSFALASFTQNLQLIQASYNITGMQVWLYIEPQAVLHYWRGLRILAKKSRDSHLLSLANINYSACLIHLATQRDSNKRLLLRLASLLRHSQPTDEQHALVLQHTLFALGQALGREKTALPLEAALACYTRCRELIEQRTGADRRQKQEMLAALSNGEALILLRQGRRERALELEKEALCALVLCGGNTQQRMLLTTHIGDLFFHAFRQIETAIAYYEDAQKLALSDKWLDSQFYIVPKLARAYDRAHKHKKVIHLLDDILQAYKLRNLEITKKMEGNYLTLLLLQAQSYIHINNPSQAANYYLECFMHPDGIAPATLRGIASNLRHCVPNKGAHFWAWISSVIEEQERRFADSMQIRDLLTSV